MTHHQYGTITGDEQTGGFVDPGQSILFASSSTLAFAPIRLDDDGAEQGEGSVALGLSGRINKSTDTVEAVFFMCIADAGMIAGMLADAAHRAGGRQGLAEFTAAAKKAQKQGLRRDA